ncbi:MAG: hypothetical protein AUF67_08105 [Acidobacteria bacterium 13_1_20CM_58_21]|nr:MAG: hypothetical protein AUF67_08105 [Acidobacteria bacterium 13_1_20CM_58_21]
MSLPFVAQKILASMPTNNESARGSLVNRKSNYAQQRRWGILSLSSPLVPKSKHLVGRQRKKGRNKTQAVFRAHRAFAESAHSATI